MEMMTQASLQIEVYVIEWTRAEDAKEDWHTHATIETYRRLGKGKIEENVTELAPTCPKGTLYIQARPAMHGNLLRDDGLGSANGVQHSAIAQKTISRSRGKESYLMTSAQNGALSDFPWQHSSARRRSG